MKRFFFFYLLVCILSLPLVAQDNELPILELLYSQPGNKTDSLARVTCVLRVKDPSRIARVHVKAGYQAGAGEVLQKIFSLNEKGNTLQVAGNKILIPLGTLPQEALYYEAVIEDRKGNMSRPVQASEDLMQSLEVLYEAAGDASASPDSMAHITCIITVKDLSEIGKVHLKAGRADGGAGIIQRIINPAETGNDWKVRSNQVFIDLGTLPYENFYYEAAVENKQGKRSRTYKHQ